MIIATIVMVNDNNNTNTLEYIWMVVMVIKGIVIVTSNKTILGRQKDSPLKHD